MSHAPQGYYLCLICCSLSVSFLMLILFLLFFSMNCHCIIMYHAATNQKTKWRGGVSRINCKFKPWAMCLISRIITLPGLSEWMVSLEFRLRGIIGFISQWWRSRVNSIPKCLKYEIYYYCTSNIFNPILGNIVSYKWDNSFLSSWIVMWLSVRINLVFVQRISLNPGLTFVNVMTY